MMFETDTRVTVHCQFRELKELIGDEGLEQLRFRDDEDIALEFVISSLFITPPYGKKLLKLCYVCSGSNPFDGHRLHLSPRQMATLFEQALHINTDEAGEVEA